jgi:hypothetical protein
MAAHIDPDCTKRQDISGNFMKLDGNSSATVAV